MGCGTIDNINKNNCPDDNFSSDNSYPDKSFPPSNISIFGKENLEKINLRKKIHYNKYYKALIKDFHENKIIWKKAKDLFNNERYSLFSNNLSSKSIIQGSIGNCYFLTIISSLTKYPSLLYQLFHNLNISENGIYSIYLNIKNEISKINIDDYFPYNIRKNKTVFCKPYKNEIWVMILEKALAKIKGSYLNIDNGSPIDVLKLLLLSSNIKNDLSYNFYSLNNEKGKNEIWNIMINKKNNKNTFMISLSKGNLKNKKKLNNLYYSIIEKHFYNINDLNEKDGKRLIRLRNPWGFNKKNKNYKINKTEGNFIIDNNEEDIGPNNDNFSSLEEGELIINYNYFIYLFEEIQIYEFKKFSINCFYNLKEDNNKVNIIKIGIKDIKINEITIDIKIIIKELLNLGESDYINVIFLIIEKENMKILNKINYKINFNNPELKLPLFLKPNSSVDYYLCCALSCHINQINNQIINFIFQYNDYIEIINYRQYYDDELLFDIIKKEFKDHKIDINLLKYKKNILI